MCRKIKSDELSLSRNTWLLNLSKVYDYCEVTKLSLGEMNLEVRDGNNKSFETSATNFKNKRYCKPDVYPNSHLEIITSFLVELLEYINHLYLKV
jgi:hypothetical protein